MSFVGCKRYTAAVVEYEPFYTDKIFHSKEEAFQKALLINLREFAKWTKLAAQRGANIIVFPENGLFGFLNRDLVKPYLQHLPEPTKIGNQYEIPCAQANIEKFNDGPVLQFLSCLAARYEIAIVANVGEVQPCNRMLDNDCPPDKQFQYNTNIVLDTDGSFIAKYRKEHLFFEPEYDQPATCENIAFTPSFGVTFGIMTCFDILYNCPAVTLINKYHIKNFVIPMAWMKGIPLLQSNQYQQAWSRSHGVNVIAANVHFLRADMTGSGIYSSGLVKAWYYNNNSSRNGSQLLVAELDSEDSQPQTSLCRYLMINYTAVALEPPPSHSKGQTFQSLMMHNIYNFVLLDKTKQGQASVCFGTLCCHLQFERDQTSEMFALAAYDGPYYVFKNFHLQVCALVKCNSNEDKRKCGQPVYQSQTIFKSLTISGTFSNKTVLYPTSLLDGIRLVQPQLTHFDPKLKVLTECPLNNPLISAALIGRL
ncbi:uncharacterized protein TRIADDRAFT_21249 [Trichoplax adhaerens]|uniref:CN hydrolase domain-containing protein n=1 Tax=Trichoplax adhaerens TaxID=10228 RepID=B3RN23_TRIAD|nr:hypothetical protein TRIADDRAFT_21249 [Trichoplax adhaerens]EDV27379.1 hypothetical protein TRIADDRAFT_21249 [Trichoplax adhaerens]|eukprot:XP_002109213.1 hypothetical protein TRIADDRAFT_21249 [Trichoplax adhaerens]